MPLSDFRRHVSTHKTHLAACLAAALTIASPHGAVAVMPLDGLLHTQMDVARRVLTALPVGSVASMSSHHSSRGLTRPATTFAVTNCGDTGAGSLRAAAAEVASGGTIDLTQLTCSTITLTSGQIVLTADSVTLIGPGEASLTISGSHTSRVFLHQGYGTFSLSDVTIADGYYRSDSSQAFGGCIASSAALTLTNTTVTNCEAFGTDTGVGGTSFGAGAGIFGNVVSLTGSRITNNYAHALGAPNSRAEGGGLVAGTLRIVNSTISGNSVAAPGDQSQAAIAGGVAALYFAQIYSSTISGNHADVIGGAALAGTNASYPIVISESTISGNVASQTRDETGSIYGAGLYVGNAALIANSTISGNSEIGTTGVNNGAGLVIGGTQAVQAHLESTIISQNTSDGIPDDVAGNAAATLIGAHDLIGQSELQTPPGTLITNPHLGPLADNGGPTQTQALLPGSPAIDAGDNLDVDAYDQRGVGYPRVVGSAADIGAYEAQPVNDTIFANGFDG